MIGAPASRPRHLLAPEIPPPPPRFPFTCCRRIEILHDDDDNGDGLAPENLLACRPHGARRARLADIVKNRNARLGMDFAILDVLGELRRQEPAVARHARYAAMPGAWTAETVCALVALATVRDVTIATRNSGVASA